MIINLEKRWKKSTMSRKDGENLKRLISDAWNKESEITINFANVLVASVGFLDEAIGKLASYHSKKELQDKIKFETMYKYDRARLNEILLSRYREASLDQKTIGSRLLSGWARK